MSRVGRFSAEETLVEDDRDIVNLVKVYLKRKVSVDASDGTKGLLFCT